MIMNGKKFRKKRADDLRQGDEIVHLGEVYKVDKVVGMTKVPHCIIYCRIKNDDFINAWVILEAENAQMVYYS